MRLRLADKGWLVESGSPRHPTPSLRAPLPPSPPNLAMGRGCHPFFFPPPFMILQRSLRPQSGLRAVSSFLPFLRTNPPSRSTHYVPQLGHDSAFKKHGIPDLLSPQGFDLSWTQYQGFLINKLNLLTAGIFHFCPMASVQVDRIYI